MKKHILCIGEVLIDGISTEVTNSLQQANSLEILVGGSVANFCLYINKCSINTTLVASVGDDGFGRKIIETLELNQINTKHVNVLQQHNTSFIAVSKTPQTPDFIAYRDADKEIVSIHNDLINNISLIHSTAFCLSKQPASQTTLDTFKIGFDKGKLISVDWNYAPSIWKDKTYANKVFESIQQYNPLLKFSLDDVSRYLNKQVNEVEAMQFLTNVNATAICLTCGSKGVYYKTNLLDWNFIAAQDIEVKNATGAGDSFWAGFISSYLSNASIKNAVENGIKIASLKLQNLL